MTALHQTHRVYPGSAATPNLPRLRERSALDFRLGLTVPEWMGDAPCTQRPEVFFPRAGHIGDRAEARRICRSCPVIQHCATRALDILSKEPLNGVWAGEYFATNYIINRRAEQIDKLRAIAGRELEPDARDTLSHLTATRPHSRITRGLAG